MAMVFVVVMLDVIFLLPVSTNGTPTIQFADDSLIPINPDYLTDESADTCAGFQSRNIDNNQRMTHFRISIPYLKAEYFNLTTIGIRLGCGRNLYISSLSSVQSEAWLGQWTTCGLIERLEYDNRETCTYSCRRPCLSGDIQVIRIPYSIHENYWEVCHINITVNSQGCSDINGTQSGEYRIKLPNSEIYTDVYCDLETNGGGWTVLLIRRDGSVNFSREWDDYKNGFGCLSGEFWIGNEILHKMTMGGQTYFLRVELESFSGEFVYAEYSNFSIGPESDNYILHISGYLLNSTAGDSLGYHDGLMFSTLSRDNDLYSSSCCLLYGSGWWFRSCHRAFLTGSFGEDHTYAKGITWYSKWGYNTFARYARMMIRPTQ